MQDEFKNIRSNFINNESTLFKRKFSDQLQIYISIWNVKLMNVKNKNMLHYKTFVKILQLKNNKSFDQIHKIFEIKY